MIKIKDSIEFERLLNALADDIVIAHIHYQLYKDLRQELSDHPKVAAESKTFWQLTLNANIHTSTLTLCRAYDKEKNSLHLYSWLLTIRKNLHLFDLPQASQKPDKATLEKDIRLCSSDDPLVKTLKNLRDKVIAHRDANLAITQKNIYDDYPFTIGDFETLLARAKDILNRYSNLWIARTNSTQIIGHDDYLFIFKSVEEKIQHMDQEE
jgi:hypothetical protein